MSRSSISFSFSLPAVHGTTTQETHVNNIVKKTITNLKSSFKRLNSFQFVLTNQKKNVLQLTVFDDIHVSMT